MLSPVHPKCEICKVKRAVVIENKKYFCGNCYCWAKGIPLNDKRFEKKNKS